MTIESDDDLEETSRQNLVADGWRQGSLLHLDEFRSLIKIPDIYLDVADTLVVATQTCDLLYPSFLIEPDAEVLLAQVAIGSIKPDVGKSFRTFGIEIESDSESHILILSRKTYPLNRRTVFKIGRLRSIRPSARSTTHFANWLAAKYNRPAYPDAFLTLTNKGKNAVKIKSACEKLHSCMGLFLSLDNWDERPTGPYKISVLLIMSANSSDSQLSEANIQHGIIESLFDVDHIEVDSTLGGVFRENEITLHDYRGLSKWQLDYLTQRDVSGNHVNPAPPTY
jgi:hypothetical protein